MASPPGKRRPVGLPLMHKPERHETLLETDTMRTIVLVFSLIVLAVPAHAAPRNKTNADNSAAACHEKVGHEEYEGEGRSHIGHLQSQRLSNCMMGMPY